RAQLAGGNILVLEQGKVNAEGTLVVQAGGDVVLKSSQQLKAVQAVEVTSYTTTEQTVDVVTGYQQVADGTIQVPEVSWQTTQVTEQVGTELVKVGSSYHTMDVTLSQTGYYNPSAAADQQFREFFIEGVDYFNTAEEKALSTLPNKAAIPVIDWTRAGDEQNPGRTTTAPSGDYKSSDYKSFSQLTDAQRWAVLNTLGYMPLYDFGYDNAVTHQTLNGNTTESAWAPDWKNNALQVFYVNVAGWRDKYVLMPVGAQEDVLRVVSQGSALYLDGDTSADGSNAGGHWVTDTVSHSGELVGSYIDRSKVFYTQVSSSFTGTASNFDWSNQSLDFDHDIGRWKVSYMDGTGTRQYLDMADDHDATISYAPKWSWFDSEGAKVRANNAAFGISAILANEDYRATLASGTASLVLQSSAFAGTQQVGVAPGIQSGYAGPVFYWWANYVGYALEVKNDTSNLVGNYNGSRGGDDWNDDIQAVRFSSATYAVQVFQHKNYGGWEEKLTSSKQNFGGHNDEITAIKVWGYRYENYWNYTYQWTAKTENVYDQRVQLKYQLATVAQDIDDYRPVYQTTTKEVMVTTPKDVTVWKSVPIIQKVTQLVPEAHTETVGSSYGDFGDAAALGAKNIVIDAGASVRLSGVVSASDRLDVSARTLVQVQGVADALGQAVQTTLQAHSLSLAAGTSLEVADNATLLGTGSGATVMLLAAQDLTLGGATHAGTGTGDSLASVTVDAGRDLFLSGAVTAGSIDLEAGSAAAGTARDGGIEADAQTVLKATEGGLSLTAGRFGGDIVLDHATLEASVTQGVLHLQAQAGFIEQRRDLVQLPNTTGDENKVWVAVGTIAARRLEASAETGLTLGTRVAEAQLALTGVGNIDLVNTGALRLDAQTADGGITVSNTGLLKAVRVLTLGASDRNDIALSAFSAAGLAGDLVLGDVRNDARGDVTLSAQGQVWHDDDTRVVADELVLTGTGAVDIATNVNSLRLAVQDAASATVAQGERRLTVQDVQIADGSFTLTGEGVVELVEVVLRTNKAGNDVKVDALQDLLVRHVSAGVHAATAADLPVVDGQAQQSLSSAGLVTLISRQGAVAESFADAAVDVVAQRLTVRAATGIAGLEIAVNELDATTTGGDIALHDFDGVGEKYTGLTVVQALSSVTAGTGNTRVAIESEGSLLVDVNGRMAGDTVSLTSHQGSVVVKTPKAGDSLAYSRGVVFDAAQTVELYRFFEAPEWMEYRAGKYFVFGTEASRGEPVTKLLPTTLSADTLILQTGESLNLKDVTLSVNRHLELEAGQNVNLSGTVAVKAQHYDGSAALDAIEQVIVRAEGATAVQQSVDVNASGSTSVNAPAQETGFINLQVDQLPALRFDLRARQDIFVHVQDDLTLSGFVGGLQGFDPARNVTLIVEGTLAVQSGIVAAATTGGVLSLTAQAVTSDGASVFISDRLEVQTAGDAQLNTLVDTLKVRSTVHGAIRINEATGLVVELASARDGLIDIAAGGDLYLREVRNFAGGSDIDLRAAGVMYVDLVEAATDLGAEKTSGRITADALHGVKEWKALSVATLQPDGTTTVVTDAYDDRTADLYGHQVTVRGAAQITQLTDPGKQGNGDDVEVRTIAAGGFSYDPQSTVTEHSLLEAGGAIVNLQGQTLTPAGVSVAQVSTLAFGIQPAAGQIYAVTVNGHAYSVTAAQGDTAAGVLGALKTRIEQGEAIAVAVDADNLRLVLSAEQGNTPFTLTGVSLTLPTLDAVTGGVAKDGSSLDTGAGDVAPGFDQAQHTNVLFDSGAAPQPGKLYGLTLDGHDYLVRLGTNAFIDVTGLGNGSGSLDVLALQADSRLGTASGTASGNDVTVDLAGLSGIVAGAHYTLTVADGKRFDVIAADGDTRASIAGKLAALADADPSIAAQASGTVITFSAG
ncbi:hypothetical protein, partial [Pseudacidovorax intermedius]|uniref:hypothetical protein n=1 Tax=Pseudacidovorax intermedius TaxID=433924 RepID=UPI0005B89BF7